MDTEHDLGDSGLHTLDFVRRAQSGSQSALNALFSRYMPFVRRLVTIKSGSRVLSRNEIDDLVQESLLAAFQSFDRFEIRHESSFRAWIYRVVVSRVLRAAESLRAQKNDPSREQALDASGTPGHSTSLVGLQLESQATLPVDRINRRELQAALDECIASFDEPQRSLLILRLFVHGDRPPWAEIGAELGLVPDAARMRCHRAMTELRRRLKSRGFNGPGGSDA